MIMFNKNYDLSTPVTAIYYLILVLYYVFAVFTFAFLSYRIFGRNDRIVFLIGIVIHVPIIYYMTHLIHKFTKSDTVKISKTVSISSGIVWAIFVLGYINNPNTFTGSSIFHIATWIPIMVYHYRNINK